MKPESGKRKRSAFMVKCVASGCGAKSSPLEDRERVNLMAVEHAVSFKHIVELHKTSILKTIDPTSIPKLTR